MGKSWALTESSRTGQRGSPPPLYSPLLSFTQMTIDVDAQELIEKLTRALRSREEQFLSRLTERVLRELRASSIAGAPGAGDEDAEIRGIQLHRLYPVSFLAERWDVTADHVRKRSEKELPRANWKGGEIRYRGIHILRYEGVDVARHADESAAEADDLPKSSSTQGPELSKSSPRSESSALSDDDGDSRIYSRDLPSLSGDSPSQN